MSADAGSTPSVILMSTDLMMTSSVGGATSAAGLPLQTITAVDALSSVTDDDLVIIDMEVPGLDISAAATALPDCALAQAIVYGPHVHTHRFESARAAGFSTVIARGEFAASLMRRVAEFAAKRRGA